MIHENIAHIVARFVFEKPARKLTLTDLARKMEVSGQKLEHVLAKATSSYAHYDCLSHIIGIERWGQQRLRHVLGEPLVLDEYDSYRPSIALFWEELGAEFTITRQQTLALIRKLQQACGDQTAAVRHNQLGIMTIHGWLLYLDMHANLEAKKFTNHHK
jgi:hypothetical protein